ncbi:MAG: hypothetical protein ACKOYN_12895 [Planctomycetota bacterium]
MRLTVRAAVVLSLAALLPAAAACQNRKVRVEIDAKGDTASRVFATNDTSSRALEAVEAAYRSKGETDQSLGRKFTGTFAENAMPSEIGNRGAIGRIDSALGSSRSYFEQFAERRGEWGAYRQRVESGILWMRLFGRYIELREVKDDARRAEFRSWWEGDMIPFASDLYVMYSGMQAVVQAQRIGAAPRRGNDFAPRTDDEMFRIQVFQPLAIMMAERGFLTADELAGVQMLALNGNVTKRERDWAGTKLFTPALQRVVQRFAPERKDMKLADFVPVAVNFVLWTKLSREYRDIVLESPAIEESVKADIRKGVWDFELPPPFGFRTLSRPGVTDATVILDTGAKPFMTNGRWNDETKRVEFKGDFYESQYRYAPYNAPYYAVWSLPSQRQESFFGAVILEGEPLSEYCGWEAALEDEPRTRWLAALEALASSKDPLPAYAILEECAVAHPAPAPLAAWIAEKAGRPVPTRESVESKSAPAAIEAPEAKPAEPRVG